MKRLLSSAMAFLFVTALSIGVASASASKPCRDARGKFIKCPTTVMAPAPKRCRDAKGKFMKCKSTTMMKK